MKKWKCTVCGYVHEGDNPPDKCPKCGAPKEKFVLVSDDQPKLKIEGDVKAVNILAQTLTTAASVNKVANVNTGELSFDTYYFEPGQVLAYHKHPTGDQIFIILQGTGVFYLDDGVETAIEVGPGSVILARKDTWHKLVNTGSEVMVASQATKQPAGMVAR